MKGITIRGSGDWLLDRTQSWRLGPTTRALLATLAILLVLIPLALLQHDAESAIRVGLSVSLLCGLSFYIHPAYANAAANDLAAISVLDEGLEREVEHMAASSTVGYIQSALAVVSSIGMNLYVAGAVWALPAGRLVFTVAAIAFAVTYYLVSFYAFDLIYRHWRVIYRSALRVPVDLLRLDAYHCYATPFVRYLFVAVMIVCLMMFFQFVLFRQPDIRLLQAVWLGVGIAVLVLIAMGYPVLTLRNRIRDAKLTELDLVGRALAGDTEALKGSRIGDHSLDFSVPDLISYQSHVRSLWTWPLHQYVQRLVLFGVLPPLSWAIAAVVEVFVQSFF